MDQEILLKQIKDAEKDYKSVTENWILIGLIILVLLLILALLTWLVIWKPMVFLPIFGVASSPFIIGGIYKYVYWRRVQKLTKKLEILKQRELEEAKLYAARDSI